MVQTKPAEDVQAPEELVEETAAAAAPQPVADAESRVQFENDLARMGRVLASQPKVQIKVQEDTTVSINGYMLRIKGKTKVNVPQQVADLLEEAGRI